jgi:hypothetical protein
MRDALRVRRYSVKTEKAYIHWGEALASIPSHAPSPGDGPSEVTAFMNYLESDRMVAGATQNQALAAMLFLYRMCSG